MTQEEPRNWQDVIQQRQQRKFVGRSEQLEAFLINLRRRWGDPQLLLVFNVFGQGGVGKSTLLREFKRLAGQEGAAVALTSEDETSLPQVMAQLAQGLEPQISSFREFIDRYRVYRQKREELEADPDAPQGLAAFMGRTATHVLLDVAKHTPGVGGVVEMLDTETIAAHVGEWTEFVRKRLTNKDERELVLEPVKVLTPFFLKALSGAPTGNKVVLMFDTYERTSQYLDDWLIDLLAGDHGPLPPQLSLVIAGRDSLNRDHWLPYEEVTAPIELNPFTEEETREYLWRHSIRDDKTVSEIYDLSGGLPLLVAMFAAQRPTSSAAIGVASEPAIARFLRWVDDPQRRDLALNAALPRVINQDILSLLVTEDTDVGPLFAWLKAMPFTYERSEGWVYHSVVREQMLRHKHREAPSSWSRTHQRLADYYEAQRTALGLDWQPGVRDPDWQRFSLSALYHQLCAEPRVALSGALVGFLDALREHLDFAELWAAVIMQAGHDADSEVVLQWGTQLADGLTAYREDDFESAIPVFSQLLNRTDLPDAELAVVLSWRAEMYRSLKHNREALDDLDRALTLSPTYQFALARRGLTFRNLEQFDRALADLLKAKELGPYRLSVALALGETYTDLERTAEALAELNKAVSRFPESCSSWQGRGIFYMKQKQYNEALSDFDRAAGVHPNSCEHYMNRAQCYEKMGRLREALDDYTQAVKQHPESPRHHFDRARILIELQQSALALEALSTVFDFVGEVFGSLFYRGKALTELGRYDEALSDLNKAIDLDENSCQVYQVRGRVLWELEQTQNALEDFDKAIALHPDSCSHYEDRARLYEALNETDKALSDRDKTIEFHSDGAHHYVHRAETLSESGRIPEALADFESAIALGLTSTTHYRSRSMALQQMGRYEDAMADLDRIIAMGATRTSELSGRAELRRLTGDLDASHQDYSSAIKVDSSDDYQLAWAMAGRGVNYLQKGETARAVGDLNRALKLVDTLDWAYYQRSLAHRLLDRSHKAAPDLAQAIHLATNAAAENPHSWYSRYNLALYYLADGQPDKARQVLESIFTRYPLRPALPLFLSLLQEYLNLFPDDEAAAALHAELKESLETAKND